MSKSNFNQGGKLKFMQFNIHYFQKSGKGHLLKQGPFF